jgi:hypothetical protein
MPLRDPQVLRLLAALAATRDEEIDCEAYLALMPECAEARAEGRPLPESLAMAEAHERLCPNCTEECRALVEAIRGDRTGAK